ncbi:MAG: LysM peptidoglycan-binding domain-containing protein [Solirubrobacteraceae bacterium]
MRPLRFIVLAAFATLVLAPSASAHVARVVGPGETLWSIAAQNNLTTRTVAAYNGLAEDAHVVLGSTILVPTVTEGAAALARSGITPAATAGTGAGGACRNASRTRYARSSRPGARSSCGRVRRRPDARSGAR